MVKFSVDSDDKRKGRGKRLLGNLLLLGCSMFVSFSVGELLVRRYYPIDGMTYQLDRRYLHRYIPNSRQIYRFSAANGGKKVLVVINGEGRRGDLVSVKRPLVMVYGDSFISAVSSPIKETFVGRLEQRLKGTLVPAPQVINCGVSGYGPDQESLVLEDEIDRLKPRLVIVSIYAGNDFGDLVRNKIYKLDDQKQLKNNDYTIDSSLVNLFATTKQFSRFYTIRLLQRAWERLWHRDGHTVAVKAAPNSDDYLDAWLSESRAEFEEYVINGNNSVRNLFEDHYDADVSLTPNSESSQYKRMLMDRVIGKLKLVTDARSIPLMLVIIPAALDVVDNYSISVDTRKYPEYSRSELTDIVEEIARKRQLPYVNLFSPFRKHGAGSLYYVTDNDHWNLEGQGLAAGLVADYIMNKGLLHATVGTRQ
jgi:hypothetical protein